MSTFFFADGTVENHPSDDRHHYWELHKPDMDMDMDVRPEDVYTVGPQLFRFARQPDGSWWECEPGTFNEHAALARLANEVESQRALLIKTARALRDITYGNDPSHGHEMLRELKKQGVPWWTE